MADWMRDIDEAFEQARAIRAAKTEDLRANRPPVQIATEDVVAPALAELAHFLQRRHRISSRIKGASIRLLRIGGKWEFGTDDADPDGFAQYWTLPVVAGTTNGNGNRTKKTISAEDAGDKKHMLVLLSEWVAAVLATPNGNGASPTPPSPTDP